MLVGNSLVACGLSNDVTHHLCFDPSKSCWFMQGLGHEQFILAYSLFSRKDNKNTIRCGERSES